MWYHNTKPKQFWITFDTQSKASLYTLQPKRRCNFPTCNTCCELTCYRLQWYCFHQIGSTVALQEHQLDQRTYRPTEKNQTKTQRWSWYGNCSSLTNDRTLDERNAFISLLRIFCYFCPRFHLCVKVMSPSNGHTFPAFNFKNGITCGQALLIFSVNRGKRSFLLPPVAEKRTLNRRLETEYTEIVSFQRFFKVITLTISRTLVW